MILFRWTSKSKLEWNSKTISCTSMEITLCIINSFSFISFYWKKYISGLFTTKNRTKRRYINKKTWWILVLCLSILSYTYAKWTSRYISTGIWLRKNMFCYDFLIKHEWRKDLNSSWGPLVTKKGKYFNYLDSYWHSKNESSYANISTNSCPRIIWTYFIYLGYSSSS